MDELENLYQDTQQFPVKKLCRTCNTERPLSSFHNTKPGKGDKYNKVNKCKDCCSRYHDKWYEENRERELERVKKWELSKRFDNKLSKGEIDSLVKGDSVGYCDICSSYGMLHIDHCHKTKNRRGFLCFSCNAGIGLFKDREELLQRAIAYLTRYKF